MWSNLGSRTHDAEHALVALYLRTPYYSAFCPRQNRTVSMASPWILSPSLSLPGLPGSHNLMDYPYWHRWVGL